jgi:tetratricopeptide (TPR) repeat protein
MARTILTVVLIIFLNVLVGCYSADSGKGQVVPKAEKQSLKPASVIEAQTPSETDIIEQVTINRQAYRRTLKMLVDHYTKTGNALKLGWAEKELAALDNLEQYNYIIEAGVAGPNLKANTSIELADYMYDEALRLENRAKGLVVFIDDDLLRVALGKYNELINKHPSSDKIDDAAFRAAGIYEHFKDYTIALLYYQRTYQWDPQTPYPAEFRAAYILDQHLARRAEALGLYQKALKKGGLTKKEKEFVEKRIASLTKSGQESK